MNGRLLVVPALLMRACRCGGIVIHDPTPVPLDARIADRARCLRDVLEYKLPGGDWDGVDAAGLIRAARALNLLPHFCARLEQMLEEREAERRLPLPEGGKPVLDRRDLENAP